VSQAPAFGRVFCYNKDMKEKNFSTIKKYAKVVGKVLLWFVVAFVAINQLGSTENGRMKRL